jgi:hypothetical protein
MGGGIDRVIGAENTLDGTIGQVMGAFAAQGHALGSGHDTCDGT